MTSQDPGLVLSAVNTYFDGERRELLAMLVGAMLFVSATAALLFVARDGFARGLFSVVLVFGLVFGGGAVSLLVRDVGLRSQITLGSTRDPNNSSALSVLDKERTRVAIVLSKFFSYRVAALAVAILAFAGMLVSRGGWVYGAATGLLLLTASQAVIDHYAEGRARTYFHRLSASLPKI